MPRYAVVVCHHCRSAFIMEPGHKTVSCRSCNKRLEAARLKVFFESDDFQAAQTARGSVVARLAGDAEAFRESLPGLGRDVMERIGEDLEKRRYVEDRRKVDEKMDEAARRTKKKGRQAILRDAFEELAAGGDVAVEAYWGKVSAQGIDRLKFDRWVDRLLETGLASAPRHGYLRKT